MNTIGVAMIVGGMAFLFSGLIFLIPAERKISPSDELIEDNVELVEGYLGEARRERWHPVESITPDENRRLAFGEEDLIASPMGRVRLGTEAQR